MPLLLYLVYANKFHIADELRGALHHDVVEAHMSSLMQVPKDWGMMVSSNGSAYECSGSHYFYPFSKEFS